MEEKLKFVLEYLEQEWSMSELCERYGIARETGYVWLRRYQAVGLEGLQEKSRAAQRYPNQTAEEIEERVLELREAHMSWGPRKLKRILERDEPGRRWPAASTIGGMLKRSGMIVGRKNGSRHRRTRSPWRMPIKPTGYGARISRAGFAVGMESGSIP